MKNSIPCIKYVLKVICPNFNEKLYITNFMTVLKHESLEYKCFIILNKTGRKNDLI